MAGTSRRGFASMDPAKQKEIASKGGRAAHAKGTAHEFTADEARVAGRKGGEAVSRDRAHMATIGRKGGESRSSNRDREGAYPIRESEPLRAQEIGPRESLRESPRESQTDREFRIGSDQGSSRITSE